MGLMLPSVDTDDDKLPRPLSCELLCAWDGRSILCMDIVSDVASSSWSKLLPSSEMSELQKLSFEFAG